MNKLQKIDLNLNLFQQADPIEFCLRMQINVHVRYTMYKLIDTKYITLNLDNNNMNLRVDINLQINIYKLWDSYC
jgi:hypothetical protein